MDALTFAAIAVVALTVLAIVAIVCDHPDVAREALWVLRNWLP